MVTHSSTPVPRHYIFTLEDGTWVVQRDVDRVQELLTGKERGFSTLDISFDIEDVELELLRVQGIVEQFDDSFVWLRENDHSAFELATSTLQRDLGVAVYHYVQTELGREHLDLVQDRLSAIGLEDRYHAMDLLNKVIIVRLHEEPFYQLSEAEVAQTLIAPALHSLAPNLRVESIRFNSTDLPWPWPEKDAHQPDDPSLIRKLEPKIKAKTVICIDPEPQTHEVIAKVLAELRVEIASVYTGEQALSLIQDIDPALIMIELMLPDIHGYEVVATVQNNPELNRIPIVILSALNSEKDRTLAYNVAQAVDYIVKPFHADQIRRKIWRILNQYTTN